MDAETLALFEKFAKPPGTKDYEEWLWQQIREKVITRHDLSRVAVWPDEAFEHLEYGDLVKAAADWAVKQPPEPPDPADDPELLHDNSDLGVDRDPYFE